MTFKQPDTSYGQQLAAAGEQLTEIPKKNKMSRPKIQDKVLLKVWVDAGGRCCICNEYMFQDTHTAMKGKFGEIAHIIAIAETGPRNLKEVNESGIDLNDATNLMVLCRKHHRLVDVDQRDFFTVDKLRYHKTTHERRISLMTDGGGDERCRVIAYTTNVADQISLISFKDIFDALWPNYSSGNPHLLSFPGKDVPTDEAYWRTTATQVEHHVAEAIRTENGESGFTALAVFAIGPIPLLFKLGRSLSDKVKTLYFQRHRDTGDWRWKNDGTDFQFNGKFLEEKKINDEINLFLSISGSIDRSAVPVELLDLPTYELIPDNIDPSRTLLSSKETFINFQHAYQEFLGRLSTDLNGVRKVNVFPAIPAPIAVFCGQQRIKSDPTFAIYDVRDNKFTLTLEFTND